MYSFSYLEPVCCSMSSSKCCFLTCIQISQEAGHVVWYSHLFQNFPQFIVIHKLNFFIFKFIFIFGRTGSSLPHAGFSLTVMCGGPSPVVVCGLLTEVASLIEEHRPQSILTSVVTAQLLRGMWDLH